MAASFDLSNAFVASTHERMRRTFFSRAADEFDEKFFAQRREEAVTLITAPQGEMDAQFGSGGMMGCKNAPDQFLSDFQHDLFAWQSENHREFSSPLVVKLGARCQHCHLCG